MRRNGNLREYSSYRQINYAYRDDAFLDHPRQIEHTRTLQQHNVHSLADIRNPLALSSLSRTPDAPTAHSEQGSTVTVTARTLQGLVSAAGDSEPRDLKLKIFCDTERWEVKE